MVRAPTRYTRGQQVEVRRLAGWTPGTVAGVVRLPGNRELYQVQVDGERPMRTYRSEQVRALRACGDCSRLKAENNDLKTKLDVVRGELRKWVNAG